MVLEVDLTLSHAKNVVRFLGNSAQHAQNRSPFILHFVLGRLVKKRADVATIRSIVFRYLQSFIGLFFLVNTLSGAEQVDFEKDVAPIFSSHCIDCHGPQEQESRFRLDRLASILAGGNSGEPAVVPGNAQASFLLKLVRHEVPDMEMPPDGLLTKGEIGKIEQWIIEGAKTPATYGPAKARVELSHWAFQPIAATNGQTIDLLIQRKLDDHGLALSPEAERRVLIRRLYLVMLGLPPSPQQVEAFVRDDRANAWEKLVESVLASPHYGERWASYWLDLVRFGETHGFEMNRERPNAWQYRDWVIRSLNEDKPYDEFVREQLVGDALDADVATGFLVAGPNDQVKGQDKKLSLQQRMNELDDMINTTGTAFLGLTAGCARCHNHKFDPISQRDYYALQAVFAGVNHGERELEPSDDTKDRIKQLDDRIAALKDELNPFLRQPTKRPAVDSKKNEERFAPRRVRFVRFTINATTGGLGCLDELEVYSGTRNVALSKDGATATSSGDFVHPLHKLEHINDGRHGNSRSWIVSTERGGWVQIELPQPVLIDRIVWGRDRKGEFSDRLPTKYRIEAATQVDLDAWELLASSDDRLSYNTNESLESGYDFDRFSPEESKRGRKLFAQWKIARKQREQLERSSSVYTGTFSEPGPTHRLYRGEPESPREQVSPGAIEALTSMKLKKDSPEQSRRRALAEWITAEHNPLTPRVIANRIWQFHFGTGVVDTPSDFGRNGAEPSHPRLLDHLANELLSHRWSLKHLHRIILQSATWRQSHRPNPLAMKVDADSRLLWRFPPRRLAAESIRDSILAVSGVLDLDNAGGPGFDPFEVEMENVRHYHAKKSYGPEDWRRMVYMTKVRQEREHVFGAFDCPDASMVVPKRSRSTTPLQALNLFNSHFVVQQSKLFAERLMREHPNDETRIERGWQLCVQRRPTDTELQDSKLFVAEHGLQQFARALLNANEFVFIP